MAMRTERGRSIFGNVSLEAISLLVAALKSAAYTMEMAVQQLEAAQAPLLWLTNGVDKLSDTLDSMNASCERLMKDVVDAATPQRNVALIVGQVAQLEHAWEQVQEVRSIGLRSLTSKASRL